MSFFEKQHTEALANNDFDGIEVAQARLQKLHEKVYAKLQLNDYDLHLIDPPQDAVQETTLSDFNNPEVLTVTYMRRREHAVMVEKLMGRDEVASLKNVQPRFHTVIEMRLTATGFTVELLMSPDAWYDQQNLVGKLSIPRHKQEFYDILQKLDDVHCMGFWRGIHLSDMHLDAKYFQYPRIMNEWLSTFTPTKDWLRLGVWYQIDADEMSDETIVTELVKQIEQLYRIYDFSIWTTDNSFRDFGE